MYDYSRPKTASLTWTKRLLVVRDQFFKEVISEATKILQEEGVSVTKKGGNYVEGTFNGSRVHLTFSLDGTWSGMKADFVRGPNHKTVHIDSPDDPRNVASQAIFKSRMI